MRAHKYGAKRTEVDGITFASKAEAKRYQELKLLEKAGEITGLVLQPKYPLYTCDHDLGWKVVGNYLADFAYLDASGEQVIEDVKGMKTPMYRWKKKHFELQSGQTITEVGRQRLGRAKAKRAASTRRSAAQKPHSRMGAPEPASAETKK